MRTAQPIQAGFTFIELLVAIISIGLVVGGLGAAAVTALQSPTLNREILQGNFLLQEVMEKIQARRRHWQNGPPLDADLLTCDPWSPLPLTGFACAITINNAPLAVGTLSCPLAATQCSQVTVTITLPTGGSVSQSWVMVL
ncbi:MAG: type II secretion system protein [Magnetococcales bacterium]|nr:type II secretion system protein [Magnetococcales bacterium]